MGAWTELLPAFRRQGLQHQHGAVLPLPRMVPKPSDESLTDGTDPFSATILDIVSDTVNGSLQQSLETLSPSAAHAQGAAPAAADGTGVGTDHGVSDDEHRFTVIESLLEDSLEYVVPAIDRDLIDGAEKEVMFLPSSTWRGQLAGYVFKLGFDPGDGNGARSALGYYQDAKSKKFCSLESRIQECGTALVRLLKEQRERSGRVVSPQDAALLRTCTKDSLRARLECTKLQRKLARQLRDRHVAHQKLLVSMSEQVSFCSVRVCTEPIFAFVYLCMYVWPRYFLH